MLPNTTGSGANPSTQRRKSEAAAHAENDKPTRHHRGGIREVRLRWAPDGQSLNVGHGAGREMGGKKCACVRYIVKNQMFIDRIEEMDNWFRKFDQLPNSDVFDKLIDMLKLPDKPNDRDSGDLIYRKLRNLRKDSNMAEVKDDPYIAITKKWLFDMAERHFAQPMGMVSGIKLEIYIKFALEIYVMGKELMKDFGNDRYRRTRF